MKLSVIIPVFNAQSTIVELVNSIEQCLKEIDFEIILINDGSVDNSDLLCTTIAQTHTTTSYISLRKNFGEHNAVMCGLNHCKGEYVVILDDDFQNPPSQITVLLNEIEKGYDVVYSKYDKKQHHFFRNFLSKINNKIATLLLKKPRNLYLSSFKIIRNEIIEEIIKYKGPYPYIDGLLLRSTNNIGTVKTLHDKRKAGKSNYSLNKLFKLYLNMVFNFSVMPLRLFFIFGIFAFIIGFIFSIYFIINKIIHPNEVLGWTSLIVAILTLSGVQLIFLGLIGEYIGKQYFDQNKTPQWVIKKTLKK